MRVSLSRILRVFALLSVLLWMGCKPEFSIDECDDANDCFAGEICSEDGLCVVGDMPDVGDDVAVEDDMDIEEDMAPDMAMEIPVASVVVTPPDATLDLLEEVLLAAMPRDSNGNDLTDRTVTWTTSDDTIATVDTVGLVTALAPGTATITATSEGVDGTATISVVKKPVAAVDITPATTSLGLAATLQLTTTVTDAVGGELFAREVTWMSSDDAIVSVDAMGLITAETVGMATITATVEGVDGTSTITVVPDPVATVTITPTTAQIEVVETVQLVGQTFDGNGTELTDRTITWTSSDDLIATVDAAGEVTGVAPGVVTITASSEGQMATATITVVARPIVTVVVTPATWTGFPTDTQQFTAEPRAGDGTPLTGRVCTWASSDASVTIDMNSGLATAATAGTATITATCETIDGTASAEILEPTVTVDVTPADPDVVDGNTVQLTATPRDAGGTALTGRMVTWMSSDMGVATVDASGLVSTVAPGMATITATVEGIDGTTTVNVLPAIATVDVVGSAAGADVAGMVTFTATPRDSGGTALTGRVCTWSSGDMLVATVDAAGVATIVAEGDTTIIATCEGVMGSAPIAGYGAVATVAITPTAPAPLAIAADQQFTAVLMDASGHTLSMRMIAWDSTDTGIATINGMGRATGVAVGTTDISATSEGVTSNVVTLTVQ